jgi:Zn-dependent peptidase ImmA (M78 family)
MVILNEIPINHRILEWARNKSNLSRDMAAQKAGISAISKGLEEPLSPSARLKSWEEGIDRPSYTQLVKIAKAYRRPLLTFFLSQPPEQEIQLLDFRTLANKEPGTYFYDAEFSALVRQTEAIQKSVREIIQESGLKPLSFVSSISMDSNPITAAKLMRETLDYSPWQQKIALRTVNALFNYIRNKAEEKGIFILLQGNLGSWHTNMFPEVFRGFTICDKVAPFIVINPNDTKTANIFTLIHELCHLWLGDTAVSNWNSLNISEPLPHIKNEQFCDQVAAEFLVPISELIEQWEKLTIGYEDNDYLIKRISRIFKVSPIVIARRLLESNKIDTDYYWDWYDQYHSEWLQIKEKIKEAKKEPPSYKIRTRTKLGNGLINTVLDAAREGKITETDASRILSIKIDNFSKIV